MNVLPETDKQVGAILEAIREVSPQVVEQAVTYYQIFDSVWLVILLLLVGVLIGTCRWCAKRRVGDDGYMTGAIVSAGLACVFSVACVSVGCDLAKTYCAPDYYAAERMIELARSGLGK